MSDTKDTSGNILYLRCRTCGEYFDQSEAVQDVFCSNLCAKKYTRCVICGNYFTKIYKDDPPVCSEKCREKHDKIVKELKTEEISGELI